MIALWYRGGALERAPYQDGRRRIWTQPPVLPPMRIEPLYLTRRERRARARVCSWPGRRSALPVGRMRPVPVFCRPPEPVEYIGHRLSDGRIDVLLYLPDGESVEARHLADVERWLLEHGVAETS
jgi:hypothetical protein